MRRVSSSSTLAVVLVEVTVVVAAVVEAIPNAGAGVVKGACDEVGVVTLVDKEKLGTELVVPKEAVVETTTKAVNEPVVAAEAADDELATNDGKDAAEAEVSAVGVDALVVVVTVEKMGAGEEASEKDVDFVAGAVEAAVAGAEDAAILKYVYTCILSMYINIC
ncbi:hypothetical protein CRG98_026553 [Punica granatum]|uniref:Uncharacterized protein n=1 Tax=Punica granatum TaxID=22663 RepID=A0A2I0JAG7_PUNGR|nr:hypothetical protein CRG98_026553 [Punica granatum]